ncbi:hypothetical protein VC83_03349 [Pseudogymnoascus destructans]|uniref:DUF7896 domain-containing protein n=1 Tax=Pseudogymnoascus destructans TaxID=655981 RepID=A0A177AH26_9PEZI|nr:uncharacterized protein VC83_03349 [Pseudogymnoascus destructans]OAF60484.1 hypothetical protein VC83_03349 [Pseudogymnoascus destructans]
MVKKWVCIEPLDGTEEEFRPINSLVKCKACNQQNKKYNAYYNAARHLRCVHFVPKTRDRKKADGGDWPPMEELKRWMKEVYESSDAAQQDDDGESASEDDVFIAGLEDPTSMSISASQSSNHMMFFDQSFLYPTAATDAPMFDCSSSGGSSFSTAPLLTKMRTRSAKSKQ